MKYLPLREFGGIANALNFSTPDYHVIGGCDVYTTKAAGGDKKLYKSIEESLESQYESLVRLTASLSPPRRRSSEEEKGSQKRRTKRGASLGVPDLYLSRASPFGPLSEPSARRTFAYLIATLNASHPDYDFSHILRPDDFRKERSLRSIMHNVDNTMLNLRPRSNAASNFNSFLAPPARSRSISAEVWSPSMWDIIDKEMGLRDCERYSYAPEDDPFDGDEGCIWSMHYLFFNKEKRRVCYLYIRGLSVISHSPVYMPSSLGSQSRSRRPIGDKASGLSVGDGAGKRASYWLGSSYAGMDWDGHGEDDDDEMVIDDGEDEVDEVPYMDLDDIRSELAQGYYSYSGETYDLSPDGCWDEEMWTPDVKRVDSGNEVGAEVMEL